MLMNEDDELKRYSSAGEPGCTVPVPGITWKSRLVVCPGVISAGGPPGKAIEIGGGSPGTGTWKVRWSGVKGLKRPSVASAVLFGPALAVNQKLYIVPQRRALVLGFWAYVSGLRQVTAPLSVST